MTTAAESIPTRGPYAKTARRRQEIIAAATSVFATQGYHGGSLRDISRRLDLSLSSVVHHFPSKDELLIAVLENAVHTGADWTEDRAAVAGVETAAVDLVRSNLLRPELLRLLAILSAEASAPDHPAHDWFDRRYERVTRELARQIGFDQSVGRVRPDADPLETAKLVVAAWDGLQLQWLIRPSEDMVGMMSRFLARLLRPVDGPRD